MKKIEKLKTLLTRLNSVVVAFSGGVDSSFLLKIASDTLKRKDILAVTAVSETYTKIELVQAKRFANSLGAEHKIIFTNELKDSDFIKNPKERCYYCKKELFSRLAGIAEKKGFKYVIDASNYDDLTDYRPGTKAKKEFDVKSPLQEARFTKSDIRKFSKDLGLSTWNLPQMACLASRIPYGIKINKDILRKIEKAEEFIKEMGIEQARVRYHHDIARIEVEKKDIKRFLKKEFCDKITKYLKRLGFRYIVLDLEGYRSGSLNLDFVSRT